MARNSNVLDISVTEKAGREDALLVNKRKRRGVHSALSTAQDVRHAPVTSLLTEVGFSVNLEAVRSHRTRRGNLDEKLTVNGRVTTLPEICNWT